MKYDELLARLEESTTMELPEILKILFQKHVIVAHHPDHEGSIHIESVSYVDGAFHLILDPNEVF